MTTPQTNGTLRHHETAAPAALSNDAPSRINQLFTLDADDICSNLASLATQTRTNGENRGGEDVNEAKVPFHSRERPRVERVLGLSYGPLG